MRPWLYYNDWFSVTDDASESWGLDYTLELHTSYGCAWSYSASTRRFNVDPAELRRLVWIKPMVHLAKEFGVSDRALSKRCKKLGIKMPPKGYWLRKEVVGPSPTGVI